MATIPSGDWITQSIIREGVYEKRTVELAINLMRHGGVFIDIGANWGLFTIILSSFRNVKCIAIEPSPFVFHLLLKNCADNHSNAELMHVALSDSNSIVQFYCPKAHNIGASRISKSSHTSRHYEIATCTLSDIIKHKKLDKIDLIKIDIEGHEYEVLSQFLKQTHIFPLNVIMEFEEPNLPDGFQLDNFLNLFTKHGYIALNVLGENVSKSDQLIENNVWFKRIEP